MRVMLRVPGLGPEHPPLSGPLGVLRHAWGSGLSQPSWPGSAGRRRGGERVKRKGVEGRTRTRLSAEHPLGMALLGVGTPR